MNNEKRNIIPMGKISGFFQKFTVLYSPFIQLPIRLVTGLLLIYFSISKLSDPYQWAEVIYQYRIIPFTLVNLVSILLSWVELFAGIGILLGIFIRSSALLGVGLVTIFLFTIQYNIWREIYIYCGCFRKQAYLTDVTYQNRNITFWVLILIVIIFLNRHPKFCLDSLIRELFKKRNPS